MPTIGFWELILILLIVLLVFGAAKLPEIGRALGKAIREFKKASEGGSERSRGTTNEPEKKDDTPGG